MWTSDSPVSSSRLKQQGAPPSPTCIYGPSHEFSADAYNHTDSEFLKSENNQNRDAGLTASTAVLIDKSQACSRSCEITHSTLNCSWICGLQQRRKHFILGKILKTADPFWCVPGGNDWWGEFQSYGHAYHVKCGSNQSIEKMGPNYEDYVIQIRMILFVLLLKVMARFVLLLEVMARFLLQIYGLMVCGSQLDRQCRWILSCQINPLHFQALARFQEVTNRYCQEKKSILIHPTSFHICCFIKQNCIRNCSLN